MVVQIRPMSYIDERVRAASGYLDLGMAVDAADELDLIDPCERAHLEVIRMRAAIYFKTGHWTLLKIFSSMLVVAEPQIAENWLWLAFANRRCDSISEAAATLTRALAIHPSDPLIHYNLAAYAALNGDLALCRKRLYSAIHLDPDLRRTAIDDADLLPLWMADALKPPSP